MVCQFSLTSESPTRCRPTLASGSNQTATRRRIGAQVRGQTLAGEATKTVG
jgi:hypothetical protein